MASTGGSAPPIFADVAKFNGTNWVTWKGLVRIAADLRGVYGYLDGTVIRPTAPNPLAIPLPSSPPDAAAATTTSLPTESPWESLTPTPSEWKVRNAWAMGLLIYNTGDAVGLGINIHGTAADAWKSYTETYEVASEVAVLNAELILRNTTYNDGQDFVEFITQMRTKWSNATALGATIDDKSFRTIILNALPRTWDPIVATLYTTQTSRDAINQLMTHWARISRDRVTSPQTATSALQATANKPGRERQRSQLTCTNPNCRRRGHIIDDCYWPGGGKAGQFPPGFGKRGGTRETTTANAVETTPTSNTPEPQVFALAAITEVPSTSTGTSTSTSDSVTVVPRTSIPIQPTVPQNKVEMSSKELSGSNDVPTSIPQTHYVLPQQSILTLLDSGASDHCFVDRDVFVKYKAIVPPRTGNSAGKDSTFAIEGTGTAEMWLNTGNITTKVVFSDSLHTPPLRSNLISVSKLVAKGASVSFKDNTAVVNNAEGREVLTAVRKDGLYIIPATFRSPTTSNIAQTKRKAVPYDVWHRRLGHIPVNVIARMCRDRVVDGLETDGVAEMKALCEDCLFGKHTAHPFNDQVPPETKLLDRVYVDIWGPAPVESAGGAKYFMLLMDGATSYRKVYFLNSKSADTTLGKFKEFHKESERQTGEKLKRIRLDMGREWHNDLWDGYAKENGILLEFTTPYAHQQNGKAERSMRTLLEMARAMLADAGLPQKYWADAIQTAVYIRNFIPPAHDFSLVPAARWHGRRQDISHLRPFGSTSYAHIPVEVSPSKLSPRSVKLTLLGFFDHTGYKLLDRSTGKVYKSRDVVFEERPPHYSTDPLVTYPTDRDVRHSDPDAIAPRPKPIATLHSPPPTTGPPVAVPLDEKTNEGDAETSEAEVSRMLDATNNLHESIAVRRSRRDTKPSQRMRESLEYLNRPKANVVDAPYDPHDGEMYVPKTYAEAMRRPDLWFAPMLKELQAMRDKGVYKLVPRPVDKNVVRSRWVFATKFDEAGNVSAHKARLVAKGFTQVLGEDYDETYASVARLESVRAVCAIAASLGLRLWQADFVSAFLNSDNTFEVYMEQPPGFEEGGDGHVWLLLKTLYGTMQGAHDWAYNLDRTYQGHGYYTSMADPQIRSRVEGDEITVTSTWTDDILGASSTQAGELKAKDELARSYELKDLGEAKFILGMKIERNEATGNIRLSQRAYSERILDRFHMSDANPRSTPLPAGITLSINDSPNTEEEKLEMKDVPYREALGSLMWLQVATRPDLSFAVNLLSRFANNPGRAHWVALRHTLGYLKGTLDYGITYFRNANMRPFGYVDADHAGDTDGSRSTEGHVFFMAGGPISWASKRQETVALSTVEAEYMAFTRAVQQAMWISKFMDEVALEQDRPVNIFADNNGAIANTQNNKNHRRTKHIRVKHHFTKERVATGDVTFTYIPSADNLADILTKPLAKEAVLRCCEGLGLPHD
ncbi:hypothetical protein Agabi119p4_8469 [Agaricus bisporus var. burnettii]|uniref:Integrase catalytic domain-containing protein n=1 Tax=Agaricus bisporus var. burnettii TaxID=192524 RepID=A0A8H7EYE9_AGABI|nr:hypothetical protein Agabi119p4_8469 [Agaricus bisporus var. burnettii]